MNTPERIITMSVQVIPQSSDPYPIVDRAIAALRAANLKMMVCPMETVIEGTLTDCLAAARAAHEACFEGGAQRAITIIRISDGLGGSTIDHKMEKYRA